MITCALLTTVSLASFAQSKQTSHTMSMEPQAQARTPLTPGPAASKQAQQVAERRAKIYQKQYSLSPQQYKGVYQAELDYAIQDEQAHMNGGQPGEGQAAQMIMARDMRLKNVMTPEQYTKYESATNKQKN